MKKARINAINGKEWFSNRLSAVGTVIRQKLKIRLEGHPWKLARINQTIT